MNARMYKPMFNDVARPLPFQMRNARWFNGEAGGDGAGDGAGTGGEGGEGGDGEQGKGEGQQQSFTQEDVDRIVGERVKRVESKYSDYKTLKAAAEGAKTAEDRIAELEGKYQTSEAARLRADIAADHGISKEDRDLFLTATDEETLTAQAKRLAERESERKKQGNRAPLQGRTSKGSGTDSAEREAARSLFGSGG